MCLRWTRLFRLQRYSRYAASQGWRSSGGRAEQGSQGRKPDGGGVAVKCWPHRAVVVYSNSSFAGLGRVVRCVLFQRLES